MNGNLLKQISELKVFLSLEMRTLFSRREWILHSIKKWFNRNKIIVFLSGADDERQAGISCLLRVVDGAMLHCLHCESLRRSCAVLRLSEVFGCYWSGRTWWYEQTIDFQCLHTTFCNAFTLKTLYTVSELVH